MASSSSSNRKGKLSLKRKRTAECLTTIRVEDGAVDEKNGTGKRPTELDSFSSRVPIAESAAQNSSSPSLLLVKDSAAEPSQDRKGQSVSDVVSDASSRWDINKIAKLQEFPPWYGLKEDKPSKGEPTSSELEIKVGNLSMKWSPLPPYCRQCLVRSRQKRAADLPKCLSPSARCGDLKKNADSLSFSLSVQNDAKRSDSGDEVLPPVMKEKGIALGKVAQEFATPSSLSLQIQNGQACSSSTSVKIDRGEPQGVHRKSIPTKNLISEQRCSNRDQQPSTPSKTLSNSATSGSTNERKVFIGCPGGQKGEQLTKSGSPAHHVDSSGTSSPLSSVIKRDSSIRSSPSKKVKGDKVQKVLIKELHAGRETLRKKSGPPVSTQLNESSKAEPPLPFLPKTGILSEGIGPGFKEKVDVKSLSDQQPKKSFGEFSKTVAPSNVEKVISSESHLKLTVGKVGLNSDGPEHSNIVRSNKAPRLSLTSSQRGSSSMTSLTRDQSKNQELNPSSPEIIIIDSDEEDEPKIPPVSTSTCLSSNLKRKLSATFCDTDKKTAKKPKVADSATGASGSPAAKLTSDMKFHSGKEHNRSTSNIKLSQGGVKGTSQSKLNVMPGRTAGPDVQRMPSSVPQAASTRESVASALKNSSSLPVRPRSVTYVCKESASMPVKHITPQARHSSSKKTNWNLSGNAKPLFKQQQSGSVEAVPVKTSQTKEQGNISKSKFSNSQTQKQKSPIKENRSNSPRTIGSFFTKQDASTSSKLSIGMPSTPNALLSQRPESRQPKSQSTFRSTSNWGFDELGRASTTSSAKHQLASTSGFQSARTIQTNEVAHMYPREDSRTNLSKETGSHSMRGNQTGSTKGTHPNRNNQPERGTYINHPKQESKSNHSAKTIHKSTNRDSESNQVSYRYLNRDQNTNRGTTEESATVIQSCPLCLQSFHQSWTTFQCDGHIAKCLAESTDDVNW